MKENLGFCSECVVRVCCTCVCDKRKKEVVEQGKKILELNAVKTPATLERMLTNIMNLYFKCSIRVTDEELFQKAIEKKFRYQKPYRLAIEAIIFYKTVLKSFIEKVKPTDSIDDMRHDSAFRWLFNQVQDQYEYQLNLGNPFRAPYIYKGKLYYKNDHMKYVKA
jgi:hypothetical protein